MSAFISRYCKRILWNCYLNQVAGTAQSAGWITEDLCFDSGQGQELFSLFQMVNTGSGAQTSS